MVGGGEPGKGGANGAAGGGAEVSSCKTGGQGLDRCIAPFNNFN